MGNESDIPAIVDAVIRDRATLKVFANPEAPLPPECEREDIEAIVAVAGWAPYHHEAKDGGVPWRFHMLDAIACRKLSTKLVKDGDKSKVPKMLAAATALVQATWRPDDDFKPVPKLKFEADLKNMEHIAAAGAAIQNLLLAATARGYHTYWSSGGILAEAKGMRMLDIPDKELLLGAVFIFPKELPRGIEVSEGKHRDDRGPMKKWARWVEL
jgi:nitroreductase